MQVVASSRDNAGDSLLHTAIYRLVRPATGYTDGYAYSTLRVMRDRNSGPGGSNVSNDDCKSSQLHAGRRE